MNIKKKEKAIQGKVQDEQYLPSLRTEKVRLDLDMMNGGPREMERRAPRGAMMWAKAWRGDENGTSRKAVWDGQTATRSYIQG